MTTTSWRVWLWSYAPLLLWIGVIFVLSSPGGSSANTSMIVGPLLNFFFPDMSDASRELVHMYVRKTAHFTEYAVLASLAFRAFSRSSGVVYQIRWVLPIVLVAAVASLDEFNQSYEAARTGSPYDVLMDICGGVAAVVILFGLNYRASKRILAE